MMDSNQTLYYVTSNPGKFDEARRFIAQHAPFLRLTQCSFDIPEIQSDDQKEVALLKAKAAWKHLQKPLIIDDSGMYFKAYNRFPGTLSKFIHRGLGLDGIFKLTQDNPQAYFQLHLIFQWNEKQHETFIGRCDGTIIEPEEYKAPESLPWNDIFLPDGAPGTYVNLKGTPHEATYSCRLRALKSFLTWHASSRVPLAQNPSEEAFDD